MNFGTYKARRDDKGNLVIENVPIFVECERGDNHFDKGWISEAVLKAKQAELEGYLPPLHIRHHENGTQVDAAGYFRIRGSGPITFKGDTRTAIFADLIVTRPGVEEDVLAARLPYRSVEIFDVDNPSINSLALLDHEPPYLELPMLMVDAPAEGRYPEPADDTLESVANATFSNPWQADGYVRGEPVVACFRRGHSAQLFLEDLEPMAVKKTKTTPLPKAAKFNADEDADEEKMADDSEEDEEHMMSDDEEGDKPSFGEGESGDDDVDTDSDEDGEGGDIASLIESITSGSISVAAMEEIKAAIIAQQSAMQPQQPEDPAAAAQQVAAAPTPGAAMKNTQKSTQFAKLAGENVALKARLDARDASDQRRDDVAEAMTRLEGRPLGSDLKEKLVAFHKEHGPAPFKSYVDSMAAAFGSLSIVGADRAVSFAAQSTNAPEEALAYTEQGTEAVAKATKFAAEHAQLVEHGATRHSKEAYVRSNMTRAGFKAVPAKVR